MDTSKIEHTAYIAVPTGRVKFPIAQVITKTKPKCTESIPNFNGMGKNIDVRIRMRTVASIKHLAINRRTINIRRKI